MEPFLQQVIELVQAEPTRAKWVVTPAMAVANNIAERLISEGIAWANLRFTTTYDLAERIAGPALARERRTLMDSAEAKGALSRARLTEKPDAALPAPGHPPISP